MSAAPPLLSISGLEVAFRSAGREVRAVGGVDLTLGPGERLGIVGESGCGKSTLLRAVMGLLEPGGGRSGRVRQAGSIRLSGREIAGLRGEALRAMRGRELAMIFQDPMTTLNPVFRVGEQVGEALRVHGLARGRRGRSERDEVLSLMEEVGIASPEARYRAYPHEFSGGMRQRALIAIALAARPSLLLADEPTTALDVTIQAQVMDLLRGINERRGTGIVLVTHDLGLAAEFCQRIAVMYAGRIVEAGPADEVVARPRHPNTAGHHPTITTLGDRRPLRPIPGSVPDLAALGPGCAFADRCPLVRDACRDPGPELVEVGTGHGVRCLAADEVADWRGGALGAPGRAATAGRAVAAGGAAAASVEARGRPEPAPAFPASDAPSAPGAPEAREPRASHDSSGVLGTPAAGSDADAAPLLRVRDLRKHFPVHVHPLARLFTGARPRRVRAVDGVSLEVYPGETLGLVGESGSGKSTLARVVLRLLEPTSGTIEFGARDLAEFRRQVQIVFQNPYSSLNPRKTVREILAVALARRGVVRPEEQEREAAELLERVGMASVHLDRYPHQFSGGQRQRIGLARALAVRPRLIVADEPVSSVDVSVQAQILALMEELQRDLGIAYLFIAHDLSVVYHVSRRVAVMYLGRIVELGDVESVFGEPLHPYTEALLSAVPRVEARARRERIILAGSPPSPLDPPPGCPFHTRCHRVKGPECATVTPVSREVRPGHWAACHWHGGEAGADGGE